MKLSDLKHDNILTCPCEKKNFMTFQANFWLDEDNKWHLDCPLCYTEHKISELNIKKKPVKKKTTNMREYDDEIPF